MATSGTLGETDCQDQAISAGRKDQPQGLSWLPAVALCVTLFFLVILALFLWVVEQRLLAEHETIILQDRESIQTRVGERVERHRAHLAWLASSLHKGDLTETVFEDHVGKYMNVLPEILCISRLNADSEVAWTAAQGEGESGSKMLSSHDRKHWLVQAKATRQDVFTEIFDVPPY